MLTQAGELSLLTVIRCFKLLQLADLRLEHGGFDLGLLQSLVVRWLGGGCGRCTLRGAQRLLGFAQLLTQAGELSLLIVIQCFELLQLADLRLEHGGLDLGLLQSLVVWC